MTQLSKERLEEISEGRGSWATVAEEKEMARRQLAAETQEPIYQVQYGQQWRDVSAISYEDHAQHGSPVRMLYAAPQVAQPVQVPDDYFTSLVVAAHARAEKAMRKFPQPNYVLNKVAEESGEVIKAVIHYTEGREEWVNVEGEIIDNLAMLIRLVQEGDQVIGFTPPDTCCAAMLKQQSTIQTSDSAVSCGEIKQPASKSLQVPEGWVPCSERMPEREYVLAADFSGSYYLPSLPNTQVGIYADWFEDGKPSWDDGDGNDLNLKQVTHWMPLPAAPQPGVK